MKLAKAKVEPTLRSMPPASMTIVMPMTMKPEFANLPRRVGQVSYRKEVRERLRHENGESDKK